MGTRSVSMTKMRLDERPLVAFSQVVACGAFSSRR